MTTMDRRQFLITGATVTLPRLQASPTSASSPKALPQKEPAGGKKILFTYDAEHHRRRLENIALCEKGIRKCLRKHLITNYLPGACSYNLWEYPCHRPWEPDEWDEAELDSLRDQGIRLVQLMPQWNDSCRLYGGDTFTPYNPAGFRRFIAMAHRRGMKVIPIISTGYFERRDRDFRKEWARSVKLDDRYYRLACCSPASAGWRAYLLANLVKLMDDYDVDGLYNDLGYLQRLFNHPDPPMKDEVLAFEESAEHDGALYDLLMLVYAEVKRRGGILWFHGKGHFFTFRNPDRFYDYRWVGEGVESSKGSDGLRETAKTCPPYVIPCFDWLSGSVADENELYLQTIPYMQFPLLLTGRPVTGERQVIPGIEYTPAEKGSRGWHYLQIRKHYQEHPEGPYSYGSWDSVPGRPEARPTHARWLKQYMPMVEEGTWAWLEIGDSDLFAGRLPPNVVASAFANRQLYLALANYNHSPAELATSATYRPVAERGSAPRKNWHLAGRSLHILQKAG